MNILVTGANGFLGQHLTIFFSEKGHEVTAANRGESRIPQKTKFHYYSIDLTNEDAVTEMIHSVKPSVVIHTAAISKPDECEKNKEACLLNNIAATKFLVKACNKYPARFIFFSTDFIFGENGPHSEDDVALPLNFYGESKLLAEQIVIESGLSYAIVRPVFIYGKIWNGMRPSFLHWIKNNLEQNRQIKVVSDQQRTPTFVNDICNGILTIIERKAEGVYHLAGKDLLSPYDMAVEVANCLGLDTELIEKATSETFPEPVVRAKRSGLKIDKAIKELDYDPVDFKRGVQLTFTNA
jgi:dTDP-4-dehydrorhamnose reductase